MWSDMPTYGRKSSQYVDLLGYCTINTPHIVEKVSLLSAHYILSNDRDKNDIFRQIYFAWKLHKLIQFFSVDHSHLTNVIPTLVGSGCITNT